MKLCVHEFGFWLSKQTPNLRTVGTRYQYWMCTPLTSADEEQIFKWMMQRQNVAVSAPCSHCTKQNKTNKTTIHNRYWQKFLEKIHEISSFATALINMDMKKDKIYN